MFAFAIWDNNHSKLVLAWDRIGEKSLFLISGPQDLAV